MPIYKDVTEEVYRADSCEPLVRAAQAGRLDLSTLARGSYPGPQLRPGELPGLSYVGFWNSVVAQDWGLNWHRNEGIEFCYLETGKLPFAVDDHQCELHAGDMTITRPWQSHKLGDPNIHAGRLHWLILDVDVRRPNQGWQWPDWMVLTREDLDELTTFIRQNDQPVWPATDEIGHCFKQISQAVADNKSMSSISRLAVYINELLVLVLDMLRRQNPNLTPSLSSSLRTVELFLDDVCNNRKNLTYLWTIEQMAQQCGLGVTRFRHLCKQLTNMTPGQYLSQCRVESAAKMLINKPEMSVTDVAMAYGYESSQYFATVFKKQYHCSPGTYRKSHA